MHIKILGVIYLQRSREQTGSIFLGTMPLCAVATAPLLRGGNIAFSFLFLSSLNNICSRYSRGLSICLVCMSICLPVESLKRKCYSLRLTLLQRTIFYSSMWDSENTSDTIYSHYFYNIASCEAIFSYTSSLQIKTCC